MNMNQIKETMQSNQVKKMTCIKRRKKIKQQKCKINSRKFNLKRRKLIEALTMKRSINTAMMLRSQRNQGAETM